MTKITMNNQPSNQPKKPNIQDKEFTLSQKREMFITLAKSLGVEIFIKDEKEVEVYKNKIARLESELKTMKNESVKLSEKIKEVTEEKSLGRQLFESVKKLKLGK